ncbi:cytochrome P450 CYP82D47-like [Morus notabilis]|uniref:cytochrome P450 CYP82D47-like n=1 Tax=Morus notabilis TaxID=981085 RepID=UPI000CECE4B4|nr:cytochrome P450 CYP82D47-like [Morus notabilis]
MKKTAKDLDQVLGGLLEEHKGMEGNHDKDDHEEDFMDVMISILDGDEEISSYDAHTIIKSTCLAFILGGSDTTSVTMTWALALLLNNREALRRVQQELDDNVGRERQVRESDVKNLVYLRDVMKETLRLYPAGLLLLGPHVSLENCTVGGYHISASTRLLVNASKLHRDPNVWLDPCGFSPERFLTPHKDVEVKGQNFQLIYSAPGELPTVFLFSFSQNLAYSFYKLCSA